MGQFEFGRPTLLLASYLVGVVLLLSPPMRRYVRRQPPAESHPVRPTAWLRPDSERRRGS